jgi:NADH-quinone oxidoreductase subunit M
MLFIAFAIKMPVFPFHTWQPDAYEQSATPVTIVLSAIMVKMGLFAVVRWLLPVLPDGVKYWMDVVMWLSVAGIVYASCMAMVQTNIKRLIAYSSIAHIGLMAACLFAHNADYLSVQGAAVQMFNHGINITEKDLNFLDSDESSYEHDVYDKRHLYNDESDLMRFGNSAKLEKFKSFLKKSK